MSFVPSLSSYSAYKDHKYNGDTAQWEREMAASATLYVGNLAFFTTEEQIYQLFSMAGELKRVIMGLDRNNKTPCGFCFVEYYTRKDALACLLYLNGTKLDERVVRTDIDPGFIDGRQFGRGKSGGQVRDEHRQEYDHGRGGMSIQEKQRQDRSREEQQRHRYEDSVDVPTGSKAEYDAFGRSNEYRNTGRKRRGSDDGEDRKKRQDDSE